MSFIRDASGMEWERIDDSEEEAESTTTVLPEEVQGSTPSPSREASSGRWTPTMQGALESSGRRGRRVARQLNWEPASARGHDPPEDYEWNGSWQWSWDDWAEPTWHADPWSAFLDSERPGWRSRRYANWTDGSDSSSQWSGESPDDELVPLPRLLARRENSPPPLPGSSKEPPAGRAQLQESSRAASRAALAVAALPGDSPQSISRDLRQDQGAALGPGQPRGSAQLRDDLDRECPGRGGDGDIQLRVSERQEKGAGEERGFLKLHNSFPPEFKARPGESWKDYWRSVEFWLASEGVNLPASVRGSRLSR